MYFKLIIQGRRRNLRFFDKNTYMYIVQGFVARYAMLRLLHGKQRKAPRGDSTRNNFGIRIQNLNHTSRHCLINKQRCIPEYCCPIISNIPHEPDTESESYTRHEKISSAVREICVSRHNGRQIKGSP